MTTWVKCNEPERPPDPHVAWVVEMTKPTTEETT